METQSIEELLDSPGLVIELWRKPTNETLQTVCAPFDETEFGPRLEQFGLQMLKAMRDKNGAGLAGPQVGLVKRIFVMMFPDHEQNNPIVCINPELKLSGKDWAANEGCLSAPGVRGLVRRKYNAVMTYRTPLGKHEELELDNVDGYLLADPPPVDLKDDLEDQPSKPDANRAAAEKESAVLAPAKPSRLRQRQAAERIS